MNKSNHCKLSNKAIEWINGELLGDGCLQSCSIYSARFQYGSKYLEYIEYIRDTLKSFGIKQSGKIRKTYIENYGAYIFSYSSLSYVELRPIRERWYPKGKKIIPKDLELTPLTCRQWYIGDGSLKHRKIGGQGRPRIVLATHCFVIPDVENLIGKLIYLGFKTTRWLSNEMYISTYSTKEFLNYIGKCPVKCYQYKFNYEMS